MKKSLILTFIAFLALVLFQALAHAHGVIGKRFIPSTITLEDPFTVDELDLFKFERNSKTKEGRETTFGFEFSKRLSPNVSIAVEWEYIFDDPKGEPRTSGAGNPEFSLNYSFLRSPLREGILSAGLSIEPQKVGSQRVAEPVTAISPNLFFGKGLGDLPDSLRYLKPLALTGSFGVNFHTRRRVATRKIEDGEVEREVEHFPTTLGYGIAVMYSIPYLQSFVKDIGLNPPFNRLFPLVEFDFETHVQRPDRGRTTAFFNPGLLWAGRYVELGVQAQVPMNSPSGKNVGVKALIHLFIDDIAPNIFTWTPWGVIGPTQR